MNIGEKIIKLRKENNLSQEQLASKIDVTRQTISNWELNETSPTLKQAVELSKVFDVSLDYLVGNENVIEAKLNNVERLSGLLIKLIRFLIVTLVVLLALYIIYNLLDFSNFLVTQKNQNLAILNCNKDSDEEVYRIAYNRKNDSIIKYSGKDIKDDLYYDYYINIYGERIKVSYYDMKAKDLINEIIDAYKKVGGSCEVDYYHDGNKLEN